MLIAAAHESAVGTKQTWPRRALFVRFRGEADMHRSVASSASIVNDPQPTKAPSTTIGFIDDRRHWAKSRCGLPRGEKPRELSICSTTVCQADLLLIPDLRADERFVEYPTVATEPHFRFYCGMPLINPQGFALGTLCVMDFQPRKLTFEQTEAIRCLAHQVTVQLELRRKFIELEEAQHQIEAQKAESERLLLNVLPKSIA